MTIHAKYDQNVIVWRRVTAISYDHGQLVMRWESGKQLATSGVKSIKVWDDNSLSPTWNEEKYEADVL